MENSGKNIYYYLEIVYLRKWLIIIPLIVCTILGALLAHSIPSYYRSTTLILVEQQQVPESYVTPTDRTPFGQRLNTMRQQIMSRTKLEKIINDFGLYKSDSKGLTGLVHGIMRKAEFESTTREDMLEKMAGDIEVKVMGDKKEEDAFSITYKGTDPYVTMQVTNTLASLFIDENLKAREQYAEGTSDFLNDEMNNAKKELASQERAVRQFKERYMGTLPQQLEANLRTLDRLQMEFQTINIELANAEDRKTMLESGQTRTGDASSSPNSLAVELESQQKQLSSLLSVYKENYPDVVVTKKRINDIKAMMNNSGKDGESAAPSEMRIPENNNLSAVKTQIAALKQRAIDVRNQTRQYEKRVEETPANEQKFADLRRDYDISLKNYQTLLEKKLNARLAENLEKKQKGEHFKIIDPANLPEKPYNVSKYKVTMAGTFAGAGIGFGLVFLLDFMNPAFRKPEEFTGVFQKPVLTVIPDFSGKNAPKDERKLRLIRKKA